MNTKHKYDVIVILAVLGFGVSLFLSVTHYYGFAVPCTITHGCETVLSSKYSVMLGLPLAVWGVGYFTAVIISALLAAHYIFWKKALTVLVSVGALGALGFLSIQLFILKKICEYCLTTDLTTLVIFVWEMNTSFVKI